MTFPDLLRRHRSFFVSFSLIALVFVIGWKAGINSGAGPSYAGTMDVLGATPTPTPTPIPVTLPNLAGAAGSNLTVPVTVGDLTGRSVLSYDLQVTFDPAVAVPMALPYDAGGTLSTGMLITANSNNPGHLIISAFRGSPFLSGSGTLIFLRFTLVGAPGQFTPLTFQDYTDPGMSYHPDFRFNDGIPPRTLGHGSITINGATPTPFLSPTPATPTPTPIPTPTPSPTPVATHFAVSAPSAVIQYFSFNVTVTALDQFNNVVTGYPGTVHFTSTDINPNGTHLPPDTTLTNGTGTFIARLGTPGFQTITATDTASEGITGTSGNIFVNAKGIPTPTPTPSPSLSPIPSPSPTCGITYLYQTFSNPAPIAPADRVSNDAGTQPGLPSNYPSVIQVGPADTYEVPNTCIVSGVAVSFAISSNRPDDLDLLLVGPNGVRTLIISDAGGSGQIVHNEYLFQWGEPAFPDETVPPVGYYFQANYPGLATPEPGGMDNFPGVSGLANYPVVHLYNLTNGTGVGTWQLYVVDDETGNLSSLPNGWTIRLLTQW